MLWQSYATTFLPKRVRSSTGYLEHDKHLCALPPSNAVSDMLENNYQSHEHTEH